MKVFWSWQSDTPGKIGRHFIRDTLAEAIEILKEPKDIEEPTEREVRDALHLDHDRQGVEGSPDLAPTIFRKIENATVFVADVTLVGESVATTTENFKKAINSNVAIEYGFALHCITDARILMVQNVHYGNREDLPFDLKHKAGPIQFKLAPSASKREIETERVRLRSVFVKALKPYLNEPVVLGINPTKFEEIPKTTCAAFYWNPGEVLASLRSELLPLNRDGQDGGDFDYRFDEQDAFYLRVIPTTSLPEQLSVTYLSEEVKKRRLQVLTRSMFSCTPARNRFGAIMYEPHGNSTVPTAFSQLFRNREIWGVTREFVGHFYETPIVAMENVRNITSRVLANFIEVGLVSLGLSLPLTVEVGAIGLKDKRLSLPLSMRQWHNELSEPIFENQLTLRKVLNDSGEAARNALIDDFIRRLYDLVGISI